MPSPHVWESSRRARGGVHRLRTALREELDELDAEGSRSSSARSTARNRYHRSRWHYTYLAQRYDLHQIGISGVDPET